MRSIGINETYVAILEDIYTGATARVHTDTQVSEKTAQLEEKGIHMDGENQPDLRFVDDVALATEDVKDIEHQLNTE